MIENIAAITIKEQASLMYKIIMLSRYDGI